MKKLLILVVIALLLPLSLALAESEAQDITRQCQFAYASGSKNRNTMQDDSYLTYYTGKYLEITAPEDMGCICALPSGRSLMGFRR